MTWIRATQPEQKKSREATILAAARKLFAAGDYENAGLNAIAREAGFTKSNVYRYFKTREDIFLRIFEEAAEDWAAGLAASLRKLRVRSSAATVANAWAKESSKHPLFHSLAALVDVSLAKNSSEEELKKFHLRSLKFYQGVLTELARIYPDISMQNIGELTLHFYYMAAGLWTGSRPGKTMQKVLKDPALADMVIHFEPSLKFGISNLIKGIRCKS